MGKDTFFCKNKTIRFRGHLLEFNQPLVMGILNITPDSFYDGGHYSSKTEMVEQVRKMISEGASIIDIGAVSTRPGSVPVSEEEEINRLKPVLNVLSKEFPETWFSIDTFRSAVAKMAVEEFGFYMINDISAGDLDRNMFDTVIGLNVPYVMMHMKGTPPDMQKQPVYENVTNEILSYFSPKVNYLRSKGCKDLIIDPGFGFGKKTEHNYKLLKELHSFYMLECPVLVGVSRKSMIYKLLGTNPDESLNGTQVVQVIAMLNGADILRVHDVKPVMEAIRIMTFYKNS